MKGEELSTRLRRFAADSLRLCRKFPADSAAKHVMRQLVRSATGGGANYEEARGAESRADFLHKMGIANKEVQSLYWLRLAADAELLVDDRVGALAREADELVAILTSSIRTARERDPARGSGAREALWNREWRTENGEW